MRQGRLLYSGLALVVALLAAGCSSTVIDGAASAAGSSSGADLGEDIRVLRSGVVQVGSADAAASIDLYEDFMCPACAAFNGAYDAQIADKVEDGSLTVSFHDLNFLNRASASGDYSTRAAAAALCVARDGDGSNYLAFRSALLAPGAQPSEGGATDLTNAELAAIATGSGVSQDASDCIESGAEVSQAAEMAKWSTNDLAQKAGGQVATPSVFAGATKVDPSDARWIDRLTG